MFVDSTDRRRRLTRFAAIGLPALACASGLLVVLSFTSGPLAPSDVLPLPGRPAAAPGRGAESAAPGTAATATARNLPTSSDPPTEGSTAGPTAPTTAPTGTSAPVPADPAPTGSPSATGHGR